MPGPDPLGLLAYGPAPGIELIPYFLALLAWVGLALAGILLSPFTALLRLLRRSRAAPPQAPAPTTEAPPAAPPPELPGEGSRDRT